MALATGAIIGIAVGGFAFLVLVLLFVRRKCCQSTPPANKELDLEWNEEAVTRETTVASIEAEVLKAAQATVAEETPEPEPVAVVATNGAAKFEEATDEGPLGHEYGKLARAAGPSFAVIRDIDEELSQKLDEQRRKVANKERKISDALDESPTKLMSAAALGLSPDQLQGLTPMTVEGESADTESSLPTGPVEGWSVADVGSWLDTNKLAMLKAKFTESEVTGKDLLAADEEKLKSFGVSASVMPIARMAIERLRGSQKAEGGPDESILSSIVSGVSQMLGMGSPQPAEQPTSTDLDSVAAPPASTTVIDLDAVLAQPPPSTSVITDLDAVSASPPSESAPGPAPAPADLGALAADKADLDSSKVAEATATSLVGDAIAAATSPATSPAKEPVKQAVEETAAAVDATATATVAATAAASEGEKQAEKVAAAVAEAANVLRTEAQAAASDATNGVVDLSAPTARQTAL